LERLILKESRTVHCCPSFEEFIESLKGNESVKTVLIGWIVVQMTEEAKMCRLLEALRDLQSLQAVEFSLPHENALKRITGQSLATFFESSKHYCPNPRHVALYPIKQPRRSDSRVQISPQSAFLADSGVDEHSHDDDDDNVDNKRSCNNNDTTTTITTTTTTTDEASKTRRSFSSAPVTIK
jgi:hypothetical protein